LATALAGLVTHGRLTIFHARHDQGLRFQDGASHLTCADLDTPCHHPYERILLAAELKPFALDVFHSPDFIPPQSGARRRVVTVHDLHFLECPTDLSEASRRHYGGQIE
jgi:hypothetical protein